MPKPTTPSLSKWFDNCGSFGPRHDFDKLRGGIEAGLARTGALPLTRLGGVISLDRRL